MTRFNTGVYGYNKDEVDEYLNKMRDDHQEQLMRKKTELNTLRTTINQIREENTTLSYQIDAESKQKENYLQHMNQELLRIESALARKQQEAEQIKLQAVKKLELKKFELEKNQDYIKKLQRELKIIKNKNRLLDQLYSD